MKDLVYGVGLNDADYQTFRSRFVNGKSEVVWICPFYTRWTNMLMRCYSEFYLAKKPSYMGCSVQDVWLRFSNFKSWMETQDWEGKHLDKDILFPGNKEYGPDTCVFVDNFINSFILESRKSEDNLPIGVRFVKATGKFQARCVSYKTKVRKHLGCFDTADEAFSAWLAFKTKQAELAASEQKDERVAKALIDRYRNYEKYK